MVTVKLWGVRWRLGAEWQPPSAHSGVPRELFPQSGLPSAGPCKDAEDWVLPSCEIARSGWDLSTAFRAREPQCYFERGICALPQGCRTSLQSNLGYVAVQGLTSPPPRCCSMAKRGLSHPTQAPGILGICSAFSRRLANLDQTAVSCDFHRSWQEAPGLWARKDL